MVSELDCNHIWYIIQWIEISSRPSILTKWFQRILFSYDHASTISDSKGEQFTCRIDLAVQQISEVKCKDNPIIQYSSNDVSNDAYFIILSEFHDNQIIPFSFNRRQIWAAIEIYSNERAINESMSVATVTPIEIYCRSLIGNVSPFIYFLLFLYASSSFSSSSFFS